MYMKFYMFDIINVPQVIAGEERPELVEVGPYSFLEVRTKVDHIRDHKSENGIKTHALFSGHPQRHERG